MSPKSPIAAKSQLAELLAAIWEIYDLDGYAVTVQGGTVYKCLLADEGVENNPDE